MHCKYLSFIAAEKLAKLVKTSQVSGNKTRNTKIKASFNLPEQDVTIAMLYKITGALNFSHCNHPVKKVQPLNLTQLHLRMEKNVQSKINDVHTIQTDIG